MPESGTALFTELSRHRPAKRRTGFPAKLRARVGRWAAAELRSGETYTAVSEVLGISETSVRRWSEAADESDEGEFLPVVVQEHEADLEPYFAEGTVLLSPTGYQVTGLDLDSIITLLRGLE